MSSMEYNKGKLVPVTWEEIVSEFPDADKDDLPWTTEETYERVGDQFYQTFFVVKRGELDRLDRTKVMDDGTIYFETYHYNGGAHWTEVVEKSLKKKNKEGN